MEFRRVLFRSHAGCADSCRPEKARHRKNRPARERRAQSPGLSLWSHFPLQRRWRRHSHGTSSVECRSLRRSRRRRAAGTDAKLERSEKIVYRLVLVDASEHRELPGFEREQKVFIDRSEERRGGKEGVRKCKSRRA